MPDAQGLTLLPQPLLLIEESPEDKETTICAFRKAGVANSIYWCPDGESALDYLNRRREYAALGSAPRPGIILLDLNMPGADGREVLQEIKADPALKAIPVIVLTTSIAEGDVESCYESGANSYVQKPVEMAGLFETIERLKNYWFQLVVLPKAMDATQD